MIINRVLSIKSTMLKGLNKPQKIIISIIIVAFFSIIFFLLLSMSMNRELSHDQHQFIAPAKLLADKLLIPYKDYVYFHVPNLTFIYAVIFHFTDHVLFAARMFNVICALISFVLIFYIAFNLFHRHHYLFRFLIASGSVVILLTNPLFIFTSGRAWNHDLPILFTLLAFIFFCKSVRMQMEKKWIFLSGLFVGLAIGTRLSFALIIIPFLCLILLYPKVMHLPQKVGMFLSFCFGCFLAMLPTIFMFILAPKQFIFGNLGYAQLNTLYRKEMDYPEAMTYLGKFIYFIKYVIINPENLILIVAFTIIILMNFRNIRQKPSNYYGFILLLSIIPFLLIGSFAPTPSWYQYFYAPVPFLVLGILYGIASLYEQDAKLKWGLKLFALIITVSIIFGIDSYRHKNNLLSTDDWIPNKVHKIGIEIENALDNNKGKVLTLAPIFPLEGGVDIYEEFAAGSFAWRVAPLLSENKREEFGVISEEDLNDFLRKTPPRAILVGFEKELEIPLVSYAKENGYKNLELSNGSTLWLSSF